MDEAITPEEYRIIAETLRRNARIEYVLHGRTRVETEYLALAAKLEALALLAKSE